MQGLISRIKEFNLTGNERALKPFNKEYEYTCTPMFIASLFTIAKTWKKPECPLRDEWIKMWYIQWNITQPYKRMK